MTIRMAIILILSAMAFNAVAADKIVTPRFVSLKASEVNVRTGPGPRYQIKWVLVKKEMPVEIITEFDQWRKIRDIGGDEGWVHKSMLMGKRTAIINSASGQRQTLYKSPDAMSRPELFAENGVIGILISCKHDWCRLKIEGTKGWIEKKNLWGIYPEEEFE